MTTSGLEKQTSAVLEFFFPLRFWPDRINLCAILNQVPKYRPNRAIRGAVMTLYAISRWQRRWRSTTSGFVFHVVTLFRSSKSIYRPDSIDIISIYSWDITTTRGPDLNRPKLSSVFYIINEWGKECFKKWGNMSGGNMSRSLTVPTNCFLAVVDVVWVAETRWRCWRCISWRLPCRLLGDWSLIIPLCTVVSAGAASGQETQRRHPRRQQVRRRPQQSSLDGRYSRHLCTLAGSGHFPLPDSSPPFLNGVGHFPPFHHHHPPIYNIKWSMCTKLIAVDRLGSVIWVRVSFQENSPLYGSVSFQIFALTAGANDLGGERNCPGGENVRGGMSQTDTGLLLLSSTGCCKKRIPAFLFNCVLQQPFEIIANMLKQYQLSESALLDVFAIWHRHGSCFIRCLAPHFFCVQTKTGAYLERGRTAPPP